MRDSRIHTNVHAVLFDLDGTLVDSRAAVVDAVAAGVREALQQHGIDGVQPSLQAIRDAMGLPSDAYFRHVLPENLQHLSAAAQAASTRHEIAALQSGNGQLFPRVLETLTALRDAGFRLAVVSNAQQGYFRAALRELDLAPLVHHSECHEELPPADQPSKPRLVQRALAALAVPGSATWMVGDRRDDIRAGHAHGCRCLGLTYGFGGPEELAEADAVSDRFDWLLRLAQS